MSGRWAGGRQMKSHPGGCLSPPLPLRATAMPGPQPCGAACGVLEVLEGRCCFDRIRMLPPPGDADMHLHTGGSGRAPDLVAGWALQCKERDWGRAAPLLRAQGGPPPACMARRAPGAQAGGAGPQQPGAASLRFDLFMRHLVFVCRKAPRLKSKIGIRTPRIVLSLPPRRLRAGSVVFRTL